MTEIDASEGTNSTAEVLDFDFSIQSREVWHYQGPILSANVGELQELWQFPSDHLPIGVTINGLHMASWNVMNTMYYHWVEKNSQGLRDSMLKDENYLIDEPVDAS